MGCACAGMGRVCLAKRFCTPVSKGAKLGKPFYWPEEISFRFAVTIIGPARSCIPPASPGTQRKTVLSQTRSRSMPDLHSCTHTPTSTTSITSHQNGLHRFHLRRLRRRPQGDQGPGALRHPPLATSLTSLQGAFFSQKFSSPLFRRSSLGSSPSR